VHPRQTEAIVAKKLANPKNEYELIAMQPWIIGEINYYIETTAWIKVRTNCSRVKNYLIRKGECMQLGANEYPSNKRLIQWLNGDYAK
jgi:hypothetical protein